jgi:hypothetical protein
MKFPHRVFGPFIHLVQNCKRRNNSASFTNADRWNAGAGTAREETARNQPAHRRNRAEDVPRKRVRGDHARRHRDETKEAILRAWESRLEDAFREAFVRQPPGAAPLEALHGALASVISRLESDEAIAMDRLMHSTEALRARKQANYEQQEKVVFAAMIERWPAPERRAALRLDAMLGVGAFRIAAEAWSQSAGRVALADALDDAFRTMRAEIMAGAEPAFAGRANPS